MRLKCAFGNIDAKASKKEMVRSQERVIGVDGIKITTDSSDIHTKEKKRKKRI